MDYTQEQKDIIESKDTHIVVVANAGTGKTTTIIEKIKYILDHNLTSPNRIMLTSFSRVAASELYEKALTSVGKIKADQMKIGTIHSICFHIINENIKLLGIKKIDIKSEAYLTSVAFNRHTNLFESKKDATECTAKYRKYLIDKVYPKSIGDERFNAIHEAQEIMESEGKYLYDDLLLKTIYLFNKYPYVLKNWQDKFDYIIADEVQDTSKIQWDIIEYLCADKTNTVMIGDAKQNIYQFRGCSYIFLESYRAKVNAKVLPLTQTFRFGQPFADISNRIIDNLIIDDVYKKHTITKIERNTKPEFKQMRLPEQIDDICDKIEAYSNSGFYKKDMNIIYRYNKEAIPFMKEFIKRKIPFTTKSGDIFERIELKFVLLSVSLCNSFNIADCVSLFSMYSDFVGDKTLTSIYEKLNPVQNIFEFLERAIKINLSGVGPSKKRSLQKMKDRFDELQKHLSKKEHSISEIANIMEIDITKFALKELELANQGNLPSDRKEFLLFFQECFEDSSFDNLLDWYNDILLNGHKIKEKEKDCVYLKTIHGCKGQTLPIVFFIADGLGDDRFMKTEEDLEAEKFVLYVGITRAEKQLFIYITNPIQFKFPFIFSDDWQEQINLLKDNNVNPIQKEQIKFKEASSSDKKLKPCIVKHTTEKAVLFSIGKDSIWVPSQYVSTKDDRFYVSYWIVKKNNLMKFVDETT